MTRDACWRSQRFSFDIALMWKTAGLKLQHDFAKSQESQKNPGLCQKRSGPEAQWRWFSPSLLPGDPTWTASSSGAPTQEGWWPVEENPGGHGDDHRAGTALLWSQAEERRVQRGFRAPSSAQRGSKRTGEELCSRAWSDRTRGRLFIGSDCILRRNWISL